MFNECFASVFTKENNSNPEPRFEGANDSVLNSIVCSYEDVEKGLDKLNNYKSSWSPSLIKDINRLEKIQVRATKFVQKYGHLSYKNRLHALRMSNLKVWCIRLDLLQTYKILHGVHNVDYVKYFTLNKNNTRNNEYKLEVKTHTSNTLGN